MSAQAADGHNPGAPPNGYDGWLIIYVIPPPAPIGWGGPGAMTNSFIANRRTADANVRAGRAATGHPIGHVHVEMTCAKGGQTETVPLTGMTSDEESVRQAGDGMGTLFRDYRGRLDQMRGAQGQGGKAAILADLAARKGAPGFLGIMRFPITWAECQHLRGYYQSFVGQAAWAHYGSQFRPRGFVGATGRHEGGGCATFGASFVDVAGLIPRPTMTSTWARQLVIGLSLIADIGGRGWYPYGSNLIANVGGFLWTWPLNAVIPASRFVPVNALRARPWFTPAEWAASQVVPLTLYDPELWYGDINAKYLAEVNGANNGATGWRASLDGKAIVVSQERGACPPPAKLKPFIDKVHDLMQD